MSKPFFSSCSLSSTLQVSSKGLRTLQAIQFIWMGTNRLFRHFDMSKFCRHILWSIRHSLSFNLVSPRGPLSSYFMWKLYRVFYPGALSAASKLGIFFFSLFFFLNQRDAQACILMFAENWQIAHKQQECTWSPNPALISDHSKNK